MNNIKLSLIAVLLLVVEGVLALLVLAQAQDRGGMEGQRRDRRQRRLQQAAAVLNPRLASVFPIFLKRS